MQRRSYCNTVFPTVQTRIGGWCASSLFMVYSDVPGGVLSTQGCSFVPFASVILTSTYFKRDETITHHITGRTARYPADAHLFAQKLVDPVMKDPQQQAENSSTIR